MVGCAGRGPAAAEGGVVVAVEHLFVGASGMSWKRKLRVWRNRKVDTNSEDTKEVKAWEKNVLPIHAIQN